MIQNNGATVVNITHVPLLKNLYLRERENRLQDFFTFCMLQQQTLSVAYAYTQQVK